MSPEAAEKYDRISKVAYVTALASEAASKIVAEGKTFDPDEEEGAIAKGRRALPEHGDEVARHVRLFYGQKRQERVQQDRENKRQLWQLCQETPHFAALASAHPTLLDSIEPDDREKLRNHMDRRQLGEEPSMMDNGAAGWAAWHALLETFNMARDSGDFSGVAEINPLDYAHVLDKSHLDILNQIVTASQANPKHARFGKVKSDFLTMHEAQVTSYYSRAFYSPEFIRDPALKGMFSEELSKRLHILRPQSQEELGFIIEHMIEEGRIAKESLRQMEEISHQQPPRMVPPRFKKMMDSLAQGNVQLDARDYDILFSLEGHMPPFAVFQAQQDYIKNKIASSRAAAGVPPAQAGTPGSQGAEGEANPPAVATGAGNAPPGSGTPGDGSNPPGTGSGTPGDGSNPPGTGSGTPGDGNNPPGTGSGAQGDGTGTPGSGEPDPMKSGKEIAADGRKDPNTAGHVDQWQGTNEPNFVPDYESDDWKNLMAQSEASVASYREWMKRPREGQDATRGKSIKEIIEDAKNNPDQSPYIEQYLEENDNFLEDFYEGVSSEEMIRELEFAMTVVSLFMGGAAVYAGWASSRAIVFVAQEATKRLFRKELSPKEFSEKMGALIKSFEKPGWAIDSYNTVTKLDPLQLASSAIGRIERQEARIVALVATVYNSFKKDFERISNHIFQSGEDKAPDTGK